MIFFDSHLPHLKLLDFAQGGHWEFFDKLNISRQMGIGKPFFAILKDLILCDGSPLFQFNPSGDLLTRYLIRNPEDLDV